MLRIFSSNRQEALFAALAINIAEPASGNPLVAEVIVAERGMDRWLWQQLAQKENIAANLDMQLPAGFVWQALRAQFPAAPRQSPYESNALAWRLMSLLDPVRLVDPAFAALRHYLGNDLGNNVLADDANQRKRFQLARRLAALFDQYLVYRHDMILAWEQGERPRQDASDDERWQALLWRQVVAQAGGEHRARLLDRFFAAAKNGKLDAKKLPARVSVFAVPALPPVYVAVLAALGAHTDIDLYALNPSAYFWGDALRPRARADAFARYGEVAALHLGYAGDGDTSGAAGNPLLANGGARIQQYFLDLADHDVQPTPELFLEPAGDTLLSRLQRDIFLNSAAPAATPAMIDASVQVHGAYSLLREIEVLHDRLLDAFQRDATLAPHDVLVLTPDIDLAAPYIDAVFGTARGTSRDIPYAITDLARRAGHPLAAAFQQLLLLPESRFTASDVLGLLETPAIARRFGRLSESDLEALRHWVRAAGVRWGLDAADRAARGLPAESAHSWQFGLERLFLGLAMNDSEALVAGRAPYADIEGSDGIALGKLQSFLDALAVARQRLSRAHDAAGWRALIAQLLSEFCAASNPDEDRVVDAIDTAACEFLDELTLAGYTGAIAPAVFRADFAARLGEPAARGGLLRGLVTFAQLTPARSLPFRIICLIGMSQDRFPRTQSPATFDLVAAAPRRGDRSRRDDDRHLFLETLLSARDCLYISYTDRSLRDSSPLQPSVVVSELIDTIIGPQPDPEMRQAVCAALITQHPLQPFSPRQYDGRDARLFSYDPDWLPAAVAAGGARQPQPAFCPAPLAAAAAEAAGAPSHAQLRLTDLHRCLKHPARWFLERRLGVFLDADSGDEIADDEPFALDDSFAINEAWIAAARAGHSAEEQFTLLAARGELPQGAFARLDWDARVSRFAPLMQRLANDAHTYAPLDVDIVLPDGRRLTGRLGAVAGTRQRLISAADKPHARLLLDAWIDHLVLCATLGVGSDATHAQPAMAVETIIETATTTTRIGTPEHDPLALLAMLVALYDQSGTRPLRFFPKSAQAWASAKTPDAASKAARAKWFGTFDNQAESESRDRSFRVCFGHEDNALADADFAALATAIFAPLSACLIGVAGSTDEDGAAGGDT